MDYIEELGYKAKAASPLLAAAGAGVKNELLENIAKALDERRGEILETNGRDVESAKQSGLSDSMLDRLTLTDARIDGIIEGVRKVISLDDPIGEVIGGGELANGLRIVKKRVPLGVIGIIYENRPNVTVDAAALCLKAGNAVILRGGSSALCTNAVLVGIMRDVLLEKGFSDCVSLVEETSHEIANKMMRLNKYIDLLIPRGSGRLINAVIENSTIPVIQTGEGNCHVFVDESADIEMAVNIVDNAKTQRPSVCNAIESILVHENIAREFFFALDKRWGGKVAVIGDEKTAESIKVEKIADDSDYAEEFLALKLSSRVVSSVSEAIAHINKFGTGHSECIVTSSLQNAEKFQREVDAAAVYVNASTRFTDGFEFGLGAEIGISTQKLHARGPMGLRELTTYKYLINGEGQTRG